MTVAPELFKKAFSLHPAGVALVLWRDGPEVRGLTLTSVASVSAEPPVFTFSVASRSRRLGSLRAAGRIVLALPQAGQIELAGRLAGPESAAGGWSSVVAPGGAPLLPEARANLEARVVHELAVGSSILFAAEVDDVSIGHPAAALVYSERRYVDVEARARDGEPALPSTVPAVTRPGRPEPSRDDRVA